jgi:hypothetical protein
MKRKLIQTTLACLLTTALALSPAAVLAQDNSKAPAGSKEKAKSPQTDRPIPFRGTITAIDKQEMTVTVGKRVFHVTSDTKLMRNSQKATLADGNVGDAVAGNYLKGVDGKLTAKMIRFGQKPQPKENPTRSEKKKTTGEQEKE